MPGCQTRQQNIAIAGSDDLPIRALSDKRQFAGPAGEAAEPGVSSAARHLDRVATAYTRAYKARLPAYRRA